MQTRTFAVLAALATLPGLAGCSDEAIESPAPSPDPGAEPIPAPTPPALRLERAQEVFNAAVLEALQDSAIARDDGATVSLSGQVMIGSSQIDFAGMTVSKAPFEITGDAAMAIGDELAWVAFDHAPLGAVRVGDYDLGYLEAAYPAVPAFNDAALNLLVLDGLDCGDYDIDIGLGYATVAGSCSADLGGIYVEFVCDVSVSLPANIEGSIHAYTPYVDVCAEFAGHNVSVTVNGEEIFSLDDISDIIWLILGL